MLAGEILFRDLPFCPKENQIFYIENGYDEVVNDFILSNYELMRIMFGKIGMDFCYLPFLLKENATEEKVRYYAPYLSAEQIVTKVQSNAFVAFVSDKEKRESLQPSLIFNGRQERNAGDVRFMQIVLADIDFAHCNRFSVINDLKEKIRDAVNSEKIIDDVSFCDSECSCVYAEILCSESSEPEKPYSWDSLSDMEMCAKADKVLYSVSSESQPEDTKKGRGLGIFYKLKRHNGKSDNDLCLEKTEDEILEEQSLAETQKILRELRLTVQRLRLEGVSLMAIHEFIDKQEPLSRMTITPDYRILLPDYNNIEIEMGALPKAIYFLYLRYPEGIICKHMPDHYTELLNIYKQLRPNTDEARLNLTITKVVNPLGNALNENIARIRKAFVEKFDEHLANNYIITGERGSQYSIPLDRNLIVWDE